MKLNSCTCWQIGSLKALIPYFLILMTLQLGLTAEFHPIQAVYTGSGGTDQFLSANHKTAKGHTLITGPGVTAFDGSTWQAQRPQISTDGNEAVQTGTPAKVEITGKERTNDGAPRYDRT